MNPLNFFKSAEQKLQEREESLKRKEKLLDSEIRIKKTEARIEQKREELENIDTTPEYHARPSRKKGTEKN